SAFLTSVCVIIHGRTSFLCLIFGTSSGDLDELNTFPTRRSSDLGPGLLYVKGGYAYSDNNEKVTLAGNQIGFATNGDHRNGWTRSEEHTSELQSRENLVCRLLLEKKKTITNIDSIGGDVTTRIKI